MGLERVKQQKIPQVTAQGFVAGLIRNALGCAHDPNPWDFNTYRHRLNLESLFGDFFA